MICIAIALFMSGVTSHAAAKIEIDDTKWLSVGAGSGSALSLQITRTREFKVNVKIRCITLVTMAASNLLGVDICRLIRTHA